MPALERELSKARQYGIARDNEELELGVRCMAAGIYDDQGKLVAGLSISAPADRLDEGWLPKLQATANEISGALGYKADQAVASVQLLGGKQKLDWAQEADALVIKIPANLPASRVAWRWLSLK